MKTIAAIKIMFIGGRGTQKTSGGHGINGYDIRAFAKYKRETGKTWDELTTEGKAHFIL